ncbi:uncharacterized [Tachysurus ichikawai]
MPTQAWEGSVTLGSEGHWVGCYILETGVCLHGSALAAACPVISSSSALVQDITHNVNMGTVSTQTPVSLEAGTKPGPGNCVGS